MDPLLRAFVALFVIMDPFSSLPVFMSLTKNLRARERARAANKAALVAGATLVFFTIFGPILLEALGITVTSFQVAGGIMLFLVAIQFVLGISFAKEENQKLDVAVVLIAVPLITGPGAMTTAIILSATLGLVPVILAVLFASFATLLVLRLANPLHNFIGVQGAEIMSRLMGLLLGAIAVEFIRNGLGV